MTNEPVKQGVNNRQMSIIGGIIVSVLVIGGLVWYFLIPPSAEKVCEHGVEIVKDEGLGEQFTEEQFNEYEDEFQKACEEEAEDRAEEIGLLEMVSERRCMLRADSMDDLDECEED